MTAIKKILFPTDFSENANNALVHAKSIADKCRGKLHLLNAYEVPMMAPINVFITLSETMEKVTEDMNKKALEKLEALTPEEKVSNYEITNQVKGGEAEDIILDAIKEDNIELLVMGTKGVTSDRGLFMSSMTKSIVQKSSCPVLAIPNKATYKEIKKIAYATDLRYDETRVINYLVEFAKMYDAEIILLHIDHFNETKEWSLDMLQDLKDKVDYDKIFHREMVLNDTIGGINDFVERYKIDMLAMTTATTSLFDKLTHRSITKEVLLHTKIPLMVFNRKKNQTVFLS